MVLLVVGRATNLIVSRVNNGDDTNDTILEKRAKTLGTLLNNLAGFVVWAVVITMALAKWGVNIAPILAGAGVVGLAVGFGAQTLVRDVVTGFFIIFENYLNVGDYVEIAGKTGRVVSMNIRTTIVIGDEGTRYIIPNSKIDIVTKPKPGKV